MNGISVKYKSLFYSLSIHLLLALIFVFIYMKHDKAHEVYSLVQLNSIHLCSPSAQAMPTPKTKPHEVKNTKKTPAKPLIQKREVVKSVSKPRPVTAPVKTVETAEVSPLVREVKKPKKTTAKALVQKREAVKNIPKPVTAPVKRVETAELNFLVQEKVVEERVKPLEKQAEKGVMRANTESSAKQEESPAVLVKAEPEVNYEVQYMEDNLALINALIKKNLSYPRLAKKRGLEGKAMVSFVLNEEGEVVKIEALGIVASILKKSAIKTVEKASSSFPHPKVALALRIPIVYKLN